MPTAVILTALQVEYQAVRAHLTDFREDVYRGTIFEVGTFNDGARSWTVAVAQVGAGNVSAGIETERAIARFAPDVAILVGVAGGLKDLRLGDVVAASRVYGYESGRAAKQFLPRPEVGRSTHQLVQRARAVARDINWFRRIDVMVGGPPQALIAPIAAGEKVVADTTAKTYQFLRANYSDAVAVEMEGRGFLEATYANGDLPAIIVRGVSDLIDEKGKSDAAGFQAVAARNAAAFAFEVLATLDDSGEAPGRVSVSGRSANHDSMDERDRRDPIGNVPHRRNFNFTGREAELKALRTALLLGEVGELTQPQAIHGLGGIGKTQLAVEYVYRYAPEYDVIWWVRCEEPTTLTHDLARLAHTLGLVDPAVTDQPSSAISARRWLEQGSARWLLVFDNARDPNDLVDYLPSTGSGHVLVTSRNPSWQRIARPFPLKTLSQDDATVFLLRRAGRELSADEQVAAAELAIELGGLPLALEQAAAFVEETGSSFTEYLSLFNERQDVLLSEGALPSEEYPHTVITTWDLAMRQIEEEAPAAADLLRLCAFLSPGSIPRDVLIEQSGLLPEPLAASLTDRIAASQTFRVLRRYSLIEVIDDRTLGVHRLVQAVTRLRLSEETRRKWALAAAETVAAAFPFQPNNPRMWPEIERLLDHGLTAVHHCLKLGIAAHFNGQLLSHIGLYLHERGDLNNAKTMHQTALRILETVHGENDSSVATVLNNLANVLIDLKDLQTARALIERSLAIDENVYGTDHPAVAVRLCNLGSLLPQLGELSEARSQLERAIAIDESHRGPEHPDLAHSLANLAMVLSEMGELDEAQRLLERALAIDETQLEQPNPMVAADLNNLAAVASAKGDLNRAREFYERSLSIRLQVLGDNHPDVPLTLGNLAATVREMGDHSQALPLYEAALAAKARVYGSKHPELVDNLSGLASLCHELGDQHRSVQLLERALEICEESSSPDHLQMIILLGNLAAGLTEVGEGEGARTRLEQAAEIIERLPDPTHQAVATILNNLGAALAHDDDLDRALTNVERAIVVSEKARNSDDERGGFYINLANIQRSMGNMQGARQSYKQAIRLFKRHGGSPHLALALRSLGVINAVQGNTLEGAIQLRDALLNYQLEPPNLEEARCFLLLGQVASTLGRHGVGIQLKIAAYVVDKQLGSPQAESDDLPHIMAAATELGLGEAEVISLLNEVENEYQVDRGKQLIVAAVGGPNRKNRRRGRG
jgi:tetratricopeptide (TPR) repeat protein/nucleoside phosphorylase